VIEIKDIGIGYGGRQILSGITTEFADRGLYCIIGPNGSGKTTFIKAIAGIKHYSGSIKLNGGEISGMEQGERARKISCLPQARPVPAIDVRTLISHGRFPHLGFSKTMTAAEMEIVEKAAEMTGTSGLMDRMLPELSGGERQRVYIAMMAAQDTEVMLLDEPAIYLDVTHQVELMSLLGGLRDKGKCIIMVAHDLPQAFSCADGLKLIAGGTLAAEGTPDEMCGADVLAESFGLAVERSGNRDGIYSYELVKRGGVK
jgi:iron complex transport system ATP-binding protein